MQDYHGKWLFAMIFTPCGPADNAAAADGAVHTASSSEPAVGCVEDRVSRLAGDVAGCQLQLACSDGRLHRCSPARADLLNNALILVRVLLPIVECRPLEYESSALIALPGRR